MRRIWLFAFFCLLLVQLLGAQNPGSQLRIRVVNELTEQGIADVEVKLSQIEEAKFSDSEGHVRFNHVSLGRHSIFLSHPAYQDQHLTDLVLISGKDLVLEVPLQPTAFAMETISIQANRFPGNVSSRHISVEETQRFAGVFLDPARVAASFPGVVQSDDQANHLIVRGNSPHGLQWRLEGAEIVAPNHLTNAGTATDRPMLSGGGTSMLSLQLLGQSTFSTGAFAAEQGNALAGVFDLGFRDGNREKFEFTAQAGLIGIDLSAEGPLSKHKRGSFLVNYRYSTVGLLDKLGVPLGDERIHYQDLAFNLSLPTSKAGKWTLFGLLGNSYNFYRGPEPDSANQINQAKELFNIDYESQTSVFGLSHKKNLGSKSTLKTSLAWSATKSSRLKYFKVDSLENGLLSEPDEIGQSLLSLNSSLSVLTSKKSNLKTGIIGSFRSFDLNSKYRQPGLDTSFTQSSIGNSKSILLQGFAKYILFPHLKWRLEGGVHVLYHGLTESFSLEPRSSITFHPTEKHQLKLAYGLHSQIQYPGVYTVADQQSLLPSNLDLGLSKAHHFVLAWRINLSEYLSFSLEPYFQKLFSIPISNSFNPTFSALNFWDDLLLEELSNQGKGRNTGLDFSLEQSLKKNFYYLLSGSVYESKYDLGDGKLQDTRFNAGRAFTATVGWEKEGMSRKERPNTWGLNFRYFYRGGLREMPINLIASQQEGRTIFDYNAGFSEKLADYFRLDFRFSYRLNRPGFTGTFSLDIQNVLNHQNEAFHYYDWYQDKIETNRQLGIIPILSYRMEF